MRKLFSSKKTTTATAMEQKASASRAANRKLFVLSLFALTFLVAAITLVIGGLIYGAAPLVGLREGRPFGIYGLLVLAVMSVAILGGLFQLLTQKSDLPEGVYVTRETGKHLWKGIDDVCAAANVPSPDHVVILPDMNAFAAEVPTRGLFKTKERVLGLGYPLLKLLSVEQAAAVLAHEMQHFAARDSRASLFNGTVREAVGLLAPETGSYNIFLSWPAQRFMIAADRIGARSSRMAEFAADGLAADLLGARTTADALIVMSAAGHSFEKLLWSPMAKSWEAGTPPPDSIMSAIDEAARSQASREAMQAVLEEELAEQTERYSSHPCLSERIAALGVEPRLPEFDNEMSAGRALLWDDEDRIRAELDALIRSDIGEAFKARAKEVATVESILEREFAGVAARAKTPEQAEILSLLMERTLYSEQTRQRHDTIIELYGDIPSSVCELAMGKVRQEDILGAEELLSAFERHPMMSGEARRFLDWVTAHEGKFPVKDKWIESWASDANIQKRIEDARRAYDTVDAKVRKTFELKDGFQPHRLEPWHIDLIVSEVRSITATDVTNIWLARGPEAGLGFPVFHMLIETREALDYAPSGLGTAACLPGPLKYVFKWVMEPALGRDRQLMYDKTALIYSARKQERQALSKAA